MSEEDLNIKYICEITGLEKNDKLVSIISEVMWDCYNSGLAQAEHDNTMGIIEENEDLKKQLDKMKQIQCNFLGTGCKRKIEEYEVQQKEFIEYLEDMLVSELDIFTVVRVCDVLSKYKEIIGEEKCEK